MDGSDWAQNEQRLCIEKGISRQGQMQKHEFVNVPNLSRHIGQWHASHPENTLTHTSSRLPTFQNSKEFLCRENDLRFVLRFWFAEGPRDGFFKSSLNILVLYKQTTVECPRQFYKHESLQSHTHVFDALDFEGHARMALPQSNPRRQRSRWALGHLRLRFSSRCFWGQWQNRWFSREFHRTRSDCGQTQCQNGQK